MAYPTFLKKLITQLQGLPGVGQRSAERYAFELLGWNEAQLHDLAHTLASIPAELRHCQECGCLIEKSDCHYCEREENQLCIVASPRDVFAIESTSEFRGSYHVLGGLLSPIDGRGPEVLRLNALKTRLQKRSVDEVILAIASTVEGDATALYLQQELSAEGIGLSRLAYGLPMGSSLDYVDHGTLSRAFTGRNSL